MTQVKEFENLFRDYLDIRYAIAVNNGSSALLASLNYLKQVKDTTHVITTPFTFKATSNMILHAGMVPIFVDIEEDGYNIDPHEVERALRHFDATHGIKPAILPVHLFGKPCNMKKINILGKDWNTPILEDASQALGASCDINLLPTRITKKCGTIGLMGTFSFYASKNLSTFQGGMIVTENPQVAPWLRKFINHGQLTSRDPMEVLGMNLAMPELLAFIGKTRLKLHVPGIEAELGRYGPEDGYYPKLVIDEPWYQRNTCRWDSPFPLERAISAAESVREALK